MIDMPDVPPQHAPVMVAQASQAKQANATADRTIGACHLIENPPDPPMTAVNSMSPVLSVWNYLKRQERPTPEWLSTDAYNAAKVSILQGPGHGVLEDKGDGNYLYVPTRDYYGQDRATLHVEIGGRTVRIIYFFSLLSFVPGGTEGYNPYSDKKYCPKGRMWKISLNPDDPIGGLISFQHLITHKPLNEP